MDTTTLQQPKSNKLPNKPIYWIKGLTDHYNDRIRKLIYLLYSKGVSQKEIAKELGITRSAIVTQYPLGGKK